MTTLSKKSAELRQEAIKILSDENKIQRHHSNFITGRVIKINIESIQFTLDAGRYLEEINIENKQLIDNEGYHYDFVCIETDQLIEICETLMKNQTKHKTVKNQSDDYKMDSAWDFVEEYYYKYSGCSDIAYCDDLQKIVDNEEEQGTDAYNILLEIMNETPTSKDEARKIAKQRLNELEKNIYENAINGYLEKQKEIHLLEKTEEKNAITILVNELKHLVKALKVVQSFGATKPIIESAEKIIEKYTK